MRRFLQLVKKTVVMRHFPLALVSIGMVLAVVLAGPYFINQNIKHFMQSNPTILTDTIKQHPLKFMEAVQAAGQEYQKNEQGRRQEQERQKLEQSFDNPLEPLVRKDENIRGNPNAPITLVEYSDFECPYCSQALATVEELRKKYGSNLRFIYKHLPLNFHPNAMDAAKYYEGIRLQSGKKAWKFHDELLNNISKVKNGEGVF